jgi:hypothetical protein
MYEKVCSELVGEDMFNLGIYLPIKETEGDLVRNYISTVCPKGQNLCDCEICGEPYSMLLEKRFPKEFLEAGGVKIIIRPDIQAEIDKRLAQGA